MVLHIKMFCDILSILKYVWLGLINMNIIQSEYNKIRNFGKMQFEYIECWNKNIFESKLMEYLLYEY